MIGGAGGRGEGRRKDEGRKGDQILKIDEE